MSLYYQMEQLKKFLKSLAPITNNEFDESSHNFTSVLLKKGEFFIKQGSICREIAFIDSGILRTFYLNEKGEEITSCFCTEQSLTTSYKSFILQESSELSIRAIEDTKLLVIKHSNLQKLYNTSRAWQEIGRKVAEREYFIMEKYASVLNNETAKQKYLRLLEEQPEVLQKASVEDIATYLGVTRRTLSRIRQEIAN